MPPSPWIRIVLWLISCLCIFNVAHVCVNVLTLGQERNQMNGLDPFEIISTRNPSSILSVNDVLLVIRTSEATENQRLPSILKTWFRFSPNTTYFTSNGKLNPLIPSTHRHQVYRSQCHQKYSVRELCCHSASEFHIYFAHEHKFQWLCRFDDDQYVNVPRLIDYLGQFEPDTQALYIGKPSWKQPKVSGKFRYWFATFGGGVCYSRFLLRLIRAEIEPKDQFMLSCVRVNNPDDIHIAYLLHTKFHINLTIAEHFHHHLEQNLFSEQLNASNIDQAITLGFKRSVMPAFMPIFEQDTFHMQTLHCLLYPDNDCLRRLRILSSQVYAQKRNQARPAANRS